jgi:hypothetical protein
MAAEMILAGLVVGRVQPSSPWAGVAWRPVAVLPEPAGTPPWTPLGTIGLTERFYAGPVEIVLHVGETGGYRDNLDTGAPKLWVALQPAGDEPPVGVLGVTADPYEGEALCEATSEAVDVVPMPAEIAARLAAFVAAHHVERPFFKRKRDRHEPDRPRLPPEDDE